MFMYSVCEILHDELLLLSFAWLKCSRRMLTGLKLTTSLLKLII